MDNLLKKLSKKKKQLDKLRPLPKDVKDDEKKAKKLLKIGELAKLADETVPTIRFWTKQGLLEVADFTKGGYQLYDQSMIKRAKKIRMLQKQKRLLISEIKKELGL